MIVIIRMNAQKHLLRYLNLNDLNLHFALDPSQHTNCKSGACLLGKHSFPSPSSDTRHLVADMREKPNTTATKPLTYFDVIPAHARSRIGEMMAYPTTFVPPFDLVTKFPQLVPKVAVLLHTRRGNTPISVKESKIGGHIYFPRDEA